MSSVPDESIVKDGIQFPGERLLIARESQGLNQRAIAEELHLPVRYIEWIEEGSFDKLPSLVFARGYIRGYAKIVGIDGSTLIDLFDKLEGLPTKKEPIRSVTKVQQQVKLGDPVMRWSSWLFLLVLIAAVGWWWKTQYSLAPVDQLKSGVSTVTTQSIDDKTLVLPKFEDSQLPENVNDASVVEQALNEEPKYLSEEDISNLQNELTTGVSADVVASKPEEQEESESETLLDKVQISFTDECWLTVKDADGKTLFSNVRKQGQTLTLSGKEPFGVLIGRVSAIDKILYNGELIDFSRYNNKNVAKFTLPLN